jgi:hypothetical protein
MKKTTKTAKTPAPATKNTAPAPARKTAAAPRIKPSAASTPSASAVVTKPKGSRVTLVAKVDVGFGNTLFVRGGGAGLSWEKGTALDCTGNDTWTLVLPAVEKPFAFKLVLNDTVWSTGEDYSAAPGGTVTVTPSF